MVELAILIVNKLSSSDRALTAKNKIESPSLKFLSIYLEGISTD